MNCTTKTFDICIIGAGPAGLSVLSAIHNPDGHLTESRMKRNQWNSTRLGSQRRDRQRQLSVCVIDPCGSWLNQWKGRFESLGIQFLRSPAWATPDYYSSAAITEYAWKHGREDELHDVELPRKASRGALIRASSEGLFKVPGTALFNDFCDDLATSLPHTFFKGCVQSIEKGRSSHTHSNDGKVYDISVTNQAENNKMCLQARHVVFAIGAANTPTIPKSVDWMHDCVDPTNPCVVHTFSWKQLHALPFKNEVIVVIGGGLSAVQAALLATRRGAKRVLHVTRRPVQSRLYDVSVDWLDARIAWSSEKGKNSRLFDFHNTPKSKRREFVANARAGATVPPGYLEKLEKAARAGKIERLVDTIATAEYFGCGGTTREISVTFTNGSAPVVANRIILATGARASVSKIPLLQNAIERFNLPVIDDLPDLDGYLQWGNENFSVVGNLALLQIGPDSGNLSGCRRCAELCANNLGAFVNYLETGGVHTNMYDVFGSDSDDSSSDSDNDSDSDSSNGMFDMEEIKSGP
jgi:hypothetical protein